MIDSSTRVGGTSARHRLIALLAVVGGACVIAGAALPWLSVYAGLDSYSGIAGTNGRLLVAGGATAVLLGLCYGRRAAGVLRYLVGAIGFALALFGAYLLAELLAIDRQLHGTYLPALGPGVFVSAAGALLILATLFIDVGPAVPRLASGGRTSRQLDPIAGVLVSLAAAAGTVHLAVAADHFAEYFLFGLFFVVVGAAQVGWAILVALAGPSRPLVLVSIGNALVVALWIVSRTSGIPFGPNAGAAEPVGYADTLTTIFEAVMVVCAAWQLLGRHRRSRVRLLAATAVLVAPATVLAVLSAVGAVGFLPTSG